MGGLMALYAISEYPDVFGGAGCVSTQFPLGDGVILGYMKKFLPAPKTHKIYFDYGTESLDAQYEPFQKQADLIMKKKGYKQDKNWVTRKFPGEGHNESSWRKRIDIPLTFLLKTD
jgi:predicted alpha/beta superfamily hydrolase